MEVLYGEGPASHTDPESCVVAREGSGEALTGASAGRVLSREITMSGVPTLFAPSGRQHREPRHRKRSTGPARSETPSMHGSSPHGNREILQIAHAVWAWAAKASQEA